MDKLNKANVYIQENHIPREELPVFHITPPCGWMNDPNGFSSYQGKTHLFYQFHPYDKNWGPMHWGHYETDDFIKWTELPVALAPDQTYDDAGCFSGSGIETDKGHLLVYTGVMEKETGKEKVTYQNQCLAFGDGKTYTKLEQNPVITGDMLPEHFSREHFRDPKIWKEEDGYYMVVGNKTDKGVPQVVLFRSEDAIKWSYVSVLARDREGELGTMWECPDFFCLENAYVLITSPQDLSATEEFHNGNNSVYYLGTYDKKQYVFDYKSVYSLDDGLDFYAPQTMLTPDGRRIMVGWMQSWDSNIRPAEQKWSCMMTLPRELRIEHGKLVQSPVREIEKYYRNAVCYQNMEISGHCQMQGIKGRVLDMTVEIVCGEYRQFTISFAQNEQYHTDFIIQKDNNMIEINRTYSGMVRDAIAIRKTKIKTSTDRLQIRLILDKYSAEVFLNDGQQVFSSTFYTPMEADEISFVCDGKAIIDIQKYDIVVD